MRQHTAGWAGLIALVGVGCSEMQPTADAPMGYRTTASLKLRNPVTGQLEPVAPEQMPAGVRAQVIAPQTKTAIVYVRGSAAIPTVAQSMIYTGTSNGHTLKEVVFYRAGLPPQSDYMLVDGKLVAVTTFTYTPITGGWYQSKSVLTGYGSTGTAQSSYQINGEYTTVTQNCNPKLTTCGPGTMVLSPQQRAVRVLALALTATSCVALAETGCLSKWLTAAAALVTFAAAAATVETGIGAVAAAGAYIGLGAALYDLDMCRAGSQGISPIGSGGGGSSGSGGGAGSSSCDDGVGGGCPQAYTS
jgi:hypothetical protein